MEQTGFCEILRCPAVFCENLRFSAKSVPPRCCTLKAKAKICRNQRKSAKNCDLAPLVPFSLSLLIPLEYWGRMLTFRIGPHIDLFLIGEIP